jgi:hypothetical protein
MYIGNLISTRGTTGVYAEELSREAVFATIGSHRCFTITGQRIVVQFKGNDHWMGEEYKDTNAPHSPVKVLEPRRCRHHRQQ